MLSIPNILEPVLAHVPAELLLLALLGMSLALIFAGSTIVKVVAFLAVGLAGAVLGGALAAQYLVPSWSIVGVILGFAVGGLVGVALLTLGVGLVVGYAGYLLALDLALSPTFALIVGVASFVVGLMLSGKVLTVATALAGGLLLFDVLTSIGFGPAMSTLVAALLTVIGLWVQLAPSKRITQPTTTNVGGQPSDSR